MKKNKKIKIRNSLIISCVAFMMTSTVLNAQAANSYSTIIEGNLSTAYQKLDSTDGTSSASASTYLFDYSCGNRKNGACCTQVQLVSDSGSYVMGSTGKQSVNSLDHSELTVVLPGNELGKNAYGTHAAYDLYNNLKSVKSSCPFKLNTQANALKNCTVVRGYK